MTTLINKIETLIQPLSKKEFCRALALGIGAFAVMTAGISYYTYSLSASYLKEFDTTTKLAKEAATLAAHFKKLQEKEFIFKELLEKNKNFDMSRSFEEKIKKHNLSPEGPWKAEPIASATDYVEIELRATFPHLSTQKLVAFLQEIYKDPMVYLKELEIAKEGAEINCTITLATKKPKAGSE